MVEFHALGTELLQGACKVLDKVPGLETGRWAAVSHPDGRRSVESSESVAGSGPTIVWPQRQRDPPVTCLTPLGTQSPPGQYERGMN